MNYLYYAIYYNLVFTNGQQNLRFSVDSSFMTHPDIKSHTPITGFMDKYLIFSMFKKQITVARSSTECEMISLNQATQQIINLMQILQDIGIPRSTTIVEQDNLITIHVVFKNTNSTTIKHFITKQLQV